MLISEKNKPPAPFFFYLKPCFVFFLFEKSLFKNRTEMAKSWAINSCVNFGVIIWLFIFLEEMPDWMLEKKLNRQSKQQLTSHGL